MIQSVYIKSLNEKKEYFFDKKNSNKIEFVLSERISNSNNSFDIEILFSEPILAFRNHDYTWVEVQQDCVANEFAPKIVELSNGIFVQPNLNMGIWEINKKYKNSLLWRFNPENSKPLTTYSGPNNQKIITQAHSKIHFPENPSLLFVKKPIEFSRSKIPFSAIVVFTDHCDFDTKENLKGQREFFTKNGIKITKGFFLNHFSKREDNASFQLDREELMKWKDVGHELCYHSLSQSIKSDEESLNDFYAFHPPFDDTITWIDHGYQPYNFSLFQNNHISSQDFENNLIHKNISTLWNYIDTGTATVGVINQFNPQHFTLLSFWKGNKNRPFIQKMQLIIKNIIFHFYDDEQLILKYKSTATNFKKIFFQKKIRYFGLLIMNLFQISKKIIDVFLFWNSNKNKPYALAKYSPIVFKHTLYDKEFYVFQTLEMIDFKKALAPENINLLIKEKGVFIAHTYFSVPMTYHKGRMFLTENTIDELVSNNFENLGIKIKENQIWNPTISELILYWSHFERLIIDVDGKGNAFPKYQTDLFYRTIS